MYKQKGIRCSDAPVKSTTGSMDKLAKGTSYSGAPPNSPAVIYFTYRWFHLWLSREERKTAFSGNRTLPLFLFSRTHVNSVIVVHEKKYSLEELQTMVDDMDYGLRLTIRTIVESRCSVLPGLKTAVPYDYLDLSSGSDWDQVLKKAEEEFQKEN
ncbi:hypothetical protein IGI04_006860 [Brassica rapa subsp. trilocularis]|uniref:Uncharacterized protein n=1 Tax=Brassica rapa subsp. trilocularis TaxID=1813537 RepID=A0ABQ7NK75_BRACM|nr:hypothetical protein IGI04_006860 [Brassica rapa subsp. trilocularis]